MKTYLVDFENVKSKGLSGIDRLTEKDHVIIFYSENSDTISFEMHCLVMQTKAQVDYMKVRVGGKNALDFQLSTLLGYLVAKGEDTHLFIISNDKGFDKLHDFWENTFSDSPACNVFRTSTITAAINYVQSAKKQAETAKSSEVPSAAEPAAAVPAIAESAAIEIEVKSADGKSSSIDVPEAMVYSMIDGTDFTESIAPKSEKSAETKKRGRKPRAEKPAGGSESRSDAIDALPEVIAPGSAHPIIAADEAHMAMYEPMLEEFLARPESKDKHAMLAGFMEGVPDADIDAVMELILASSCKLELHNMLMKRFDNETSTHYYTMVKKNYYFLKRALPDTASADTSDRAVAERIAEVDTAAAAEVKEEQKETAAKKEKKKTSAKKKPQKTSSDEIKPADDKKQPDKKSSSDKPAQEIKKVNAAMKRKLHELLDGNATPDEFSGVVSVMNASATSQQLYINLMQRYSRTRGRELYRLVKDAYADFKSTSAPAEKKTRSSVKQKQTEIEDGESRLRELTDGVIKPENFNDVYEAVLEANTVHRLYLGLIRRFGRNFGAQIYAAVKTEHEAIKAALTRESQS